MAQDITLLGATYSDVPAVTLPKASGGSATFVDAEDILNRCVYYGTCGTAAGTAAKVATVDGVTELYTGLVLAIKFTYANTVANPTFNVNSLGAKAIYQYGTTKASDTAATTGWQAGHVVLLIYDGTGFQFIKGYNTNTTYSKMSVAEYTAGTSTAARVITAANLKGAIELWSAQGFDVVTPSFSSLPKTFYSSDLTANCKVVGNAIELSNPDAASDDWVVTFAAGSLTISGTFKGSTATTAKMSIWIPAKTITLSSTA